MMKAFFQSSYARYILLSIGMVIAVFIGYSIVFHHKLSNAEIDQLEMQSTFGQDDTSLLRLKKAADHGQIEAKMAVGKSYLFKHQYPLAIAYLDSAAQQGNVEAATTLGKIYFQGDDRLTKTPELALKYFNQAYAQQDPSAAYYLGLIYKNGYGLKVDIVKANQYFQFAADHQIANAMFMLGNAYQYGDGKQVNLQQAYLWYQKAADLELPEAIQELAHIYQYGNQAIEANKTAYQQQMMEIGHSLKHPALSP
ncbi:tetratricopeptide repeat protein [Acinetobacter gerneri]|uniref:tetratricopeptide repeat protein n=1 Tax=Acinetobacter gerneri TaxID=202952 RepID=UPI0028A7FEE5|nr:tetratricopeptide repeat protein [Acinetobacter gerneri]